ncbi:hypothetical protein BR93DRAFT_65477 [Coniochaeta sp. PMI_546]|nr:hypothetical protein BR93DRAFT_65477 [Coniochaeta sp. PMI_546]
MPSEPCSFVPTIRMQLQLGRKKLKPAAARGLSVKSSGLTERGGKINVNSTCILIPQTLERKFEPRLPRTVHDGWWIVRGRHGIGCCKANDSACSGFSALQLTGPVMQLSLNNSKSSLSRCEATRWRGCCLPSLPVHVYTFRSIGDCGAKPVPTS